MAKIKDFSVYLLYRAIKFVFFIFPRNLCLLKGRILGLFFFYFDRKHRSIALSNLESALGKEAPRPALKKIARNSFMHFGEFLMDLIKLSCLKQEKKNNLMSIEGEENLQKALKEKKGVLLFSAHYGNWEVAPLIISQKGILNVIARPLDNKLLENELLKLRKSFGEKVIYKHMATRHILRALHANEIVAILIDQNVLPDEAVFVDFFGRLAATTPSLAAFYLRTESPVIPAFCYPTPSHGYRMKILKPLEISLTGDYSQDVLKITQLCTKIIEAQIRKKPDYWLWFHNRWKTRPEDEEKHRLRFQ